VYTTATVPPQFAGGGGVSDTLPEAACTGMERYGVELSWIWAVIVPTYAAQPPVLDHDRPTVPSLFAVAVSLGEPNGGMGGVNGTRALALLVCDRPSDNCSA